MIKTQTNNLDNNLRVVKTKKKEIKIPKEILQGYRETRLQLTFTNTDVIEDILAGVSGSFILVSNTQNWVNNGVEYTTIFSSTATGSYYRIKYECRPFVKRMFPTMKAEKLTNEEVLDLLPKIAAAPTPVHVTEAPKEEKVSALESTEKIKVAKAANATKKAASPFI